MVGFFQILAGLKDVRRHLTFDSFREEYGTHLREHLQKKGVKLRSIFGGIVAMIILLIALPYCGFWLRLFATAAIVIWLVIIITSVNNALQAMVLADHQTMKILRDKYNKTVSRVPSTPRRRS